MRWICLYVLLFIVSYEFHGRIAGKGLISRLLLMQIVRGEREMTG